MKFITKFLILFICTQFYFLDVIGCGSTSKKIKYFSYDGQTYTCEVNEKIGRYANLHGIGNDYNKLDGYTFMGWAFLPYASEEIKSLDELEASSEIIKITNQLPHPNLDELAFYPILIRNDLVEDFYQNSNLSKIVIEVIYSYPYKNGTKYENVKVEGRINQTFEEIIGEYDQYTDVESGKTYEFDEAYFENVDKNFNLNDYPQYVGNYRLIINYTKHYE